MRIFKPGSSGGGSGDVTGIGTPTVDGFGIRELPIYSDDTGKVISAVSGYGLYPTDKLLEVGTLWFGGAQGTLGTNLYGSNFQFQGSGTWVQQPLFPYASVQPLGVSGSTHYPFSNGSIQKLHLGYDQADALASTAAGEIKVKDAIPLKLSTVDRGVELNSSGTKPAASSTYRGQLFLERGGTGVADVLYMCMKDAADAYSWVVVKSA